MLAKADKLLEAVAVRSGRDAGAASAGYGSS